MLRQLFFCIIEMDFSVDEKIEKIGIEMIIPDHTFENTHSLRKGVATPVRPIACGESLKDIGKRENP